MKVTVVPADNLIIVDGEALRFSFQAPDGMHALQWADSKGHIEWRGAANEQLDADGYGARVAAYVAMWQAEKERLEQEAAEDEEARLLEYNSSPARFKRLREERDRRIAATDYLMSSDYPITEEQRSAISAYRQALRDLPAQEGAPWDGGGDETPWPEMPAI